MRCLSYRNPRQRPWPRNWPIRTHAFINGDFQPAASGQTFATINPATGEHIADVAHCMEEDVDRAVRAARRAFDDGEWSRAAPEARKEVLLKLADLVRDNAHELAVMESVDCGKTISDALAEIGGEAVGYFPVVRRTDPTRCSARSRRRVRMPWP